MTGFAERRQQQEFQKEGVWVSFITNADLVEMTDEDLKALGEFVVEASRDARDRRAQGLE